MNEPSRNGPELRIVLATVLLPDPLSPKISTGCGLLAATATMRRSFCITGDRPTIPPDAPSCEGVAGSSDGSEQVILFIMRDVLHKGATVSGFLLAALTSGTGYDREGPPLFLLQEGTIYAYP